jgi:hypothetical protein
MSGPLGGPLLASKLLSGNSDILFKEKFLIAIVFAKNTPVMVVDGRYSRQFFSL